MPRPTDEMLDHYLAISRAIAGQLDFQSVLRHIADEVSHLIPHDHMDVAIIERDGESCLSAYEVGLPTKWGETSNDPQPIAFSPVRELLWGKVPYLHTDDAWEDERFHFDGAFSSPIFEAGLHSRMHVPLQVHGVIHGTLNISSQDIGRYTADDVDTARQVADLIAPYIYALIRGSDAKKMARAEGAARGREEALRQGALRLTEGMEKERRHLGMDLHDQTLADLTRISRHISRLTRQGEASVTDIAKLGAEVATCMNELRRIIEDTKPGVLDLFGFAEAVETQLERSVAGVSPAIATEVRDHASALLDDCPESLRTALFRIVQEAINNAVRHGAPTRLSVTMSVDGDDLRIAICDDGNGGIPKNCKLTGGLDNMRVRAALISAGVEVAERASGPGAEVVVRIPVAVLTPDGGVQPPAHATVSAA